MDAAKSDLMNGGNKANVSPHLLSSYLPVHVYNDSHSSFGCSSINNIRIEMFLENVLSVIIMYV